MKALSARVVSVHAGSNDDLSKDERATIQVDLDGVVGDRHRSYSRTAWAGDKQPEGTVRRNERQWSAVSLEELAEIQKAMEDVSRDTFDYYLDTETGDVLSFSEEILEEVRMRILDTDSDDFDEQIEYVEFDEEPELPDWMFDEIELAMEIFLDTSGRYVRIPERKSSAAFTAMEQFIQTMTSEIAKILNLEKNK